MSLLWSPMSQQIPPPLLIPVASPLLKSPFMAMLPPPVATVKVTVTLAHPVKQPKKKLFYLPYGLPPSALHLSG